MKFYSDVGTGMGSDAHIRRDRALAVARALRSSWPVIVASLDRFARDADTIEDKVIQGSLVVISAQNGEHATGAEFEHKRLAISEEASLSAVGPRTPSRAGKEPASSETRT